MTHHLLTTTARLSEMIAFYRIRSRKGQQVILHE